MKKFVLVDRSGQPLYTTVPSDWTTMQDGAELIEGTLREYAGVEDDSFILASVYWKEGWKVRPIRPSNWHTWDTTTESWLPNLDAAKAAKKTEIEAERNRRINEPLIYDGKVLDADQAARDNLKAKLEEVRERIRLNMLMAPELLVWRDNGNQTHSWPTIEVYHDWLAGYAVAMSDRGTRCYACAWYHKDTLKVANDPSGQPWTVESILAYELSQGWPT